MEGKFISKFYPDRDELSTVCSKVKCIQENCHAVFQSTSNLNMHLIKHHKIPNNGLVPKKAEAQYFCPNLGCPYHKDSNKHFTKFKYLKQHFLKVHALKDLSCDKCDKKFATESFRNLHTKNCGKLFSCICGSYYTSPEALLTHCKRKGKDHFLVKNSKSEVNCDNNKSQVNKEINFKNTKRFICPKLSNDISFPVHYVAAIALSELSDPFNNGSKVSDKGIQTNMYDFLSQDKNNVLPCKHNRKRKNSQQTQTVTAKNKKLKISKQTQTINDYLKPKSKANYKTILKKKKKSMETQTKKENDVEINKLLTDSNYLDFVKVEDEKTKKWLWDNQFLNQKETSGTKRYNEIKSELFKTGTEINLCNKGLDFNEYENTPAKSIMSNCRSEQEANNQMFDINRLCNIETQTEIDAFLTECNEDTTFTLCSTTETQTTEDFDSLLYSNMCTQTCEEVDQFFNFSFVHIETQTAWPSLSDCNELNS